MSNKKTKKKRRGEEGRKTWLKREATRQNEIYGNCKVYSPSGNLMFLCVEKKARWYLDRTDKKTGEPLGREILHINPAIRLFMTLFNIKSKSLKVQLTFEPKNEGNKGDKYSLSKKHNRCVVTGDTTLKDLTKHHITPYEYRIYMPEEYKSANSHDIVPIIKEKHYDYEVEADKLKEKIAKMYNAPLENDNEVDHRLFYAIKAAVAIKNHGDKMPKESLDRNKERIRAYTGNKRVTRNMIDKLCATDFGEAKQFKSHGQVVMEKLIMEGEDAIQEFVEMWREHFIRTMKPKYMPKYWDIKRPAARDKISN